MPIKSERINLCFDSILVRLKVRTELSRIGKDKFRFHTGSIKSQTYIYRAVFGVCFDSILVRLKGIEIEKHTGTLICFDSILVRLKVYFVLGIHANPDVSFDSILVRLKAWRLFQPLAKKIGFDSILVRLKGNTLAKTLKLKVSFDSILVRLKGTRMPHLMPLISLVSIPYWFD